MTETADSNHLVEPPAAERAEAAEDDGASADDQFEATSALMRLLLGGLLEGADTSRDWLREWERAARSAGQPIRSQTAPESLRESLRYAVVGMLFEAEAHARERVSGMLSRFARLCDDAEYMYTMRLAPALRQTPLDGLRKGLDEALLLTMQAADRWTARGWIEEQRGRRMARQATVTVIDELLEYMAHNPEVRRLIEQQGLDIADSAVDEVRERTASADMWIEQLARRLLHRPVNGTLARRADTQAAPPAVTDGQVPAAPTAPAVRPSAQAGMRGSAPAVEAQSPGDPGWRSYGHG